jgi:hypothetical protein
MVNSPEKATPPKFSKRVFVSVYVLGSQHLHYESVALLVDWRSARNSPKLANSGLVPVSRLIIRRAENRWDYRFQKAFIPRFSVSPERPALLVDALLVNCAPQRRRSSVMYRLPNWSTASPRGPRKEAAVANPPSPEKPRVPLPARLKLFHVSILHRLSLCVAQPAFLSLFGNARPFGYTPEWRALLVAALLFSLRC